MKNKLFKISLLSLALGSPIFFNPLHAQDNAVSDSDVYTWHDGTRQRTIRLNRSQIMEFDPDVKKQTANDNTAPQATLNKKIEKPMRVLRMESGMDSRSQIRELKSLNKNKNYSEIFQDGKAGSGRKRALPGNIIVHLNPDWNQQEVDDWLSRNNLQLVKKFDFGKNILLIKTSAGLVSLQKANEIYNTGEVVAAYPNWWKEVSKK